MNRSKTIVYLWIPLFMVFSCVSQHKKQLRGLVGDWSVKRIYNTDVSAAEAVIRFQPRNTLAGNTGCNTLFGSYEVDFSNSRLIFRNLMSTKMACPGIKNDCEQKFLRMVQECAFFKTEATNVILLLDKDKKTIAEIRKQ